MPTVLWETLRCCIALHCVVRLGLIMSWSSIFLFVSAILHANNPLKNALSEFVLVCQKAAPLHFIQAAPQLVLSALIGNFAKKVACFSRIVLHPIAKSHVKPWSVRERHYTSPTVPSVCFRKVEIDQRKILSFFGGGHSLFGLILAAPLQRRFLSVPQNVLFVHNDSCKFLPFEV